MAAPHTIPNRAARRAFTLAELMIAVAVLLVLILAVSRIFGTVSRVTSIGTGTADVLQEAAAIERQIRTDFERLSRDGVFGIRSIRVDNDINGARLLNPNLPPDATVRCDQLVFFTTGVGSIQTYRIGEGSGHRGQATAARVYYGHAVQLLAAQPFGSPLLTPNHAHDLDQAQLWPWYEGNAEMIGRRYDVLPFSTTNLGGGLAAIDATQPEARRWLLARQQVVLADDGGSTNLFLADGLSADSILLGPTTDALPLLGGRVDAAASQLNDVRNTITRDATGALVNWPTQRSIIENQLFYFPRAERFAPSGHRVDQALTNHVISSACSSFRVEWTYDGGVPAFDSLGNPGYAGSGAVYDAAGNVRIFPGPDGMLNTGDDLRHGGVVVPRDIEQPWFGLPDPEHGVDRYTVWDAAGNGASTIDPDNIEFWLPAEPEAFYSAIFGYNETVAVDVDGVPAIGFGYTPWPSAVRITMTLHDPETALENGREFQFVVRLPKRGMP